jgi:hypothetical protein
MALSAQALTTMTTIRRYLNLYTLTDVTSTETLDATDTSNVTFQFDNTDLAINQFGTFAEVSGTASTTLSTANMTIDYSLGQITFTASRTGSITISSYTYYLWDYDSDNQIERWINSASDLVSRHCNRKFIKDTYTEWHKGLGQQELVCNEFPINYITSVKSLSSTYTAGTEYETSIQTYLDKGIVFRGIGWTWYGYQTGYVGDITGPVRHIEVSYSAGYTLEPETSRTLPYDLEDVVINMVSESYNSQTRQNNGLISLKEGELQYKWDTSKQITERYASVLNKYKKGVMPT